MNIERKNIEFRALDINLAFGLEREEFIEKVSKELSSLDVEHLIIAGFDSEDKLLFTLKEVGSHTEVSVSIEKLANQIALQPGVVKLVNIHNHPKSSLAPRLYSLTPSEFDLLESKRVMDALDKYRLIFENYIVSNNEILDYTQILVEYFDIVDQYIGLRHSELLHKISFNTDPISKKQFQIELMKIIRTLHPYFLNEAVFNKKDIVKIRTIRNK